MYDHGLSSDSSCDLIALLKPFHGKLASLVVDGRRDYFGKWAMKQHSFCTAFLNVLSDFSEETDAVFIIQCFRNAGVVDFNIQFVFFYGFKCTSGEGGDKKPVSEIFPNGISLPQEMKK